MTISRRTLLSSGLTMFAASSVPFQAIADGRKAGDGQMEYIALEMDDIIQTIVKIDGDGAPKPAAFTLNKNQVRVLASSIKNNNYRKFPDIIVSAMEGSGGEDRLTENVSLNFSKTLDNALRKANDGKGLMEGENIVRAQLKNPKWSITIKIVIKF